MWVGLQSGVACEQSGVSVAGNIRTLACMKDRSGSAAITLDASSLRFSSLLGFLSGRRHKRTSGRLRPEPGRDRAAHSPSGRAGLLHGGHEASEGVGHAAASAARVQLGGGELEQLRVYT